MISLLSLQYSNSNLKLFKPYLNHPLKKPSDLNLKIHKKYGLHTPVSQSRDGGGGVVWGGGGCVQ